MVVIGRGTQRGGEVAITCVQTNYYTNTSSVNNLGASKKPKFLSMFKNLAQREFPDATFHGNTMSVNLTPWAFPKRLPSRNSRMPPFTETS